MLDDKKILLGITGGISAYKIPELVRSLQKAGEPELEIIMTSAAEKFVSAFSLGVLNKKRVWLDEDFFAGYEVPHIKLASWADLILIAPCSADFISDLATGRANNLLSAVVLAADLSRVKILIAPAMNEHMLNNLAVQENLNLLKRRGFIIISPDVGYLACGATGAGRLPKNSVMINALVKASTPQVMLNKKVLVTAGPTHEYIDPVRFISNPSTGKMGLAMARAAWFRGAEVKLILGPTSLADDLLHDLDVIRVVSADEMRDAVMKNLAWANFIVMSAAVGDYKAKFKSANKIKREGKDELTLELVQNQDIAALAGANKKPGQILIGFAAETQDLISNARAKLERKRLDFIVANDVSLAGAGFGGDNNIIKLLAAGREPVELAGSKLDVAASVWKQLRVMS